MDNNKITILLPSYLHENYKEIFEDLGYLVIWTDNENELETLIRKNKIDIAFEWQHSRTDYTILTLVRKYYADVPVVLMLNWNGQPPGNFAELDYADVISSVPTVQEIRDKINKFVR